jgi:hypothetical protein
VSRSRRPLPGDCTRRRDRSESEEAEPDSLHPAGTSISRAPPVFSGFSQLSDSTYSVSTPPDRREHARVWRGIFRATRLEEQFASTHRNRERTRKFPRCSPRSLALGLHIQLGCDVLKQVGFLDATSVLDSALGSGAPGMAVA